MSKKISYYLKKMKHKSKRVEARKQIISKSEEGPIKVSLLFFDTYCRNYGE